MEIDKLYRKNSLKQIWYRIMTVLSGIVVFVTTYMLILPAITMENDAICGIIAHTHDGGCYGTNILEPDINLICSNETLEIHQHESTCYEGDHMICGYADFIIHKHEEICYESETLCCVLEEIELHIHEESCYDEMQTLICSKPTQLHTHDASCYENESLICGMIELREHQHNDECVEKIEKEPERVLICDIKEHVHISSCYPQTMEEVQHEVSESEIVEMEISEVEITEEEIPESEIPEEEIPESKITEEEIPESEMEQVFVLPDTGGMGTNGYTLGGLLCIMIAVLWIYIQQKTKGGNASV